jgi:PST family polysaccharide transporter
MDTSRLASRSSKRHKLHSYGRAAKAGALWKFTSESLHQLIEIPTVVILARLLTPEDFGIAAAAGFFLRLSNKLGGFGFGGAALQRLKELRAEHITSVFVMNLVSGVCLWAGLTVSAPALAGFFRNEAITPALRVAALVYLVQPFGVGQFAVMNRELRFKQIALVSWVYPAVFLCVAVPLAFLGFAFWSLIYGQLCASVLQVLAKVYYGGQPRGFKVSRQALRETIPFGAGISAKRLLNFGAEYLDSLIVGRLFGMTALGFYDKGFNTMARFVDRLSFGPSVFFRIFAIIQDEPERLRRAYRKVVLSVTLLAYPPFAALIAIAPQFIEVVYGEQWKPAVLPFQILCVAGAMRLLVAYASAATQAVGIIWAEVWRQMAYVALVVGAVLLFSPWGIAGAAFGVSLATVTMAVLMQALACRMIGIRWREVLGAQVPGLVAAAGLVLVLYATAAGLRMLVREPAAWQVLVLQGMTGFLFVVTFTLYGPFRGVRDVAEEALADFAPALLRFLGRTVREERAVAPTSSRAEEV